MLLTLGAVVVSGLGKENRQEVIVLMLSIVGLTLFECNLTEYLTKRTF